MKKAATRAEREYMGRVAALGCYVCRTLGYGPTPAIVHHVRMQQGMASRPSHFLTVPLCEKHHANYSPDGIHGGREEWTRHNLTQMDALADTIRNLCA